MNKKEKKAIFKELKKFNDSHGKVHHIDLLDGLVYALGAEKASRFVQILAENYVSDHPAKVELERIYKTGFIAYPINDSGVIEYAPISAVTSFSSYMRFGFSYIKIHVGGREVELKADNQFSLAIKLYFERKVVGVGGVIKCEDCSSYSIEYKKIVEDLKNYGI